MSKKYVPSFLRNQVQPTASEEKPLVNTSLPARNAPKLVPGTLASLTGSVSTVSAVSAVPDASVPVKKTYGAKYNQKSVAEPIINCKSEEDFPSLGGKPKVVSSVVTTMTKNFASLAKGWAEKTEEEVLEEERLKKKEVDRIKSGKITSKVKSYQRSRTKPTVEYNDEVTTEEQEDNDSFSSVSEGHEDDLGSDEQEEIDSEYNSYIGKSRRHNDDLY